MGLKCVHIFIYSFLIHNTSVFTLFVSSLNSLHNILSASQTYVMVQCVHSNCWYTIKLPMQCHVFVFIVIFLYFIKHQTEHLSLHDPYEVLMCMLKFR